jgi:hypothetical protein
MTAAGALRLRAGPAGGAGLSEPVTRPAAERYPRVGTADPEAIGGPRPGGFGRGWFMGEEAR